MVKVADFIAQTVAQSGVSHVFMVTGGGAMHLNDSFGNCSGLDYTCCHHEQACTMAAEGYARISGQMGFVNVTTGPGGINALNGVFGAWADSIPMLIISGQVKRELCITNYRIPGLRQLGDQEADIIGMVKEITKYAVSVTDPESIRYHLERAIFLAKSGRPGPCWIDVPIDVQASQIDPEQIPAYDPAEDAPEYVIDRLPEFCSEIIDRIQKASRPVILAGKGIRQANALALFERLIRRFNIPVATGWQGIDMLNSDDPLYCGRPGDLGNRAGNFTVQNSDLLLVLGCRLSIRHTSHNWAAFARQAFKIQVDSDSAELRKPTVKIDFPIHCDVRLFLDELNKQVEKKWGDTNRHAEWLAWCQKRVHQYPVVQPKHRIVKENRINPYYFLEVLFKNLAADDVIVCGDGSANVIGFQTAFIKQGQRMFCNTGDASMGYDLPAAIGAAVANNGRRVICLAGDGSLQFNIQELQTVVHHALPIKLLVLNNDGYLSIRMSQSNFFHRFVGESSRSGVSFPDIVKVAQAYGLPACRIEGENFESQLLGALDADGPMVCDVMLDPEQTFEPKLSSRSLPDGRMVSAPLEDMYPFLSREELRENLLIPPMEF